ncbi:MAG: 4Fe-4S binding protein [Clostridia bacterium]|nr:4Fe-4S binding protein [Clostridia bacterium]
MDDMRIILYAASIALVLIITIIIVVATNKHKNLDKTSEVVRELLPGLDCGKCGRVDCQSFAVDMVKGKTNMNNCPYLTGKNYFKCRQIMKKQRKVKFDYVAFVKCKGGVDCKDKFKYVGDNTCASKNLQHSGDKYCPFACLGCGDCVKACVYGAISISKKGCAIVDAEKCVGCGECVSTCPNKLISLIPSKKFVEIVCANNSTDSIVTRNCSVACSHCEACIVACPANAIKMVGGMPQIDDSKCIKCGKCVAACPNHVISRI